MSAAAANPTSTQSTASSAAQSAQNHGFIDNALQILSIGLAKNLRDDFHFTFLSSPQRVKPASSVDADTFYMYACGSINMP